MLTWPNSASKANSDDWLIQNHDRIKIMKPKILLINFANGVTAIDATRKANRLIECIREGSRYHGYSDPNAPAFLQYEIAKTVDLTDQSPLPEDQKLDGNSSKYPRISKKDINFGYGSLFSQLFADLYGFDDPSHPSHKLTLKELVDKGIIHEVWFVAYQGDFGAPFESTEVKQAYDDKLHKLVGKSVQSGNGGTEDQPFIGRSLRIVFLNATRGPGCAMESLSHSIEATANCGVIPYFKKYFDEFAMFDLKRRYGTPFNSLYERPSEVSYPDPTTLRYTRDGKTIDVKNYVPAGNSVHFPPNGRHDYDLDNPATVMSTIEHFRMRDGNNKGDKAEPWTIKKFEKYRELANDCMGPWLVYWRQNFPGLSNKSLDDAGKPMKNWWPFLFY